MYYIKEYLVHLQELIVVVNFCATELNNKIATLWLKFKLQGGRLNQCDSLFGVVSIMFCSVILGIGNVDEKARAQLLCL